MATWEECNKEIEPIIPPPRPIPPSDCPDLSEDTVTADKLLSGYTAHDANGEEITGTMTGADFITKSVTITNLVPNKGFSINGVATWNPSTERLRMTAVNVSAPELGSNIVEVPIFQGTNMLWFSSSTAVSFTNVSSGITFANGGQPITFGSSSLYVVRIIATASGSYAFTIESAS